MKKLFVYKSAFAWVALVCFLVAFLFGCDTSVNISGESMVEILQYKVIVLGVGEAFDSITVKSKCQLQSVIEIALANYASYDQRNNLEDIFGSYDDNFFESNTLILHGALFESTLGWKYGIVDYNIQQGHFDLNLKVTQRGLSRGIGHSLLLIEVATSDIETARVGVLLSQYNDKL